MGQFNPYQHWLGISEAKPDHYRLLGLNRFESDSAKISASAEAQLARLRSASPGEFVEQWCELVNELALAMKCLTDESARKAYDQQLRASLQRRSAAAGHAAPAPSSKTSPKPSPAPPVRNQEEDDDDAELPPTALPQPGVAGASASGNPYSLPLPGAARPTTWPEPPPAVAPPPPGAAPNPWTPIPAVPMPPGQSTIDPAEVTSFPSREPSFLATPRPDAPLPFTKREESPAAALLEAREQRARYFLIAVGSLAVLILIGVFVVAFNNPDSTSISRTNTEPSETVQETKSAPPATSQVSSSTPPATVSKPPETTPATSPIEKPPVEKPRRTEPDPAMKPAAAKKPPKSVLPEPASPMPEMPSPAAKPSPTPEPKPAIEPKPAPIKPDPLQVAEFRDALLEVRKSLGNREFDAAKEQLAAAESLAKGEKQQEQWERMKQLDYYVNEFWEAVRESLAKLEGGSELKINNTVVAIVEASPKHLILRVAGKNIRYAVPKELKAPIAIELAETWFDQRPENKVFLGAFQAVDPRGDVEEAKRLWREAEEAGINVKGLLELLNEISQAQN